MDTRSKGSHHWKIMLETWQSGLRAKSLLPVRLVQVQAPKDGECAYPARGDLKLLLRHLVQNREAAAEVGVRARLAARAWSWQKAGVRLLAKTGVLVKGG
jgi:hypothetical protein